MRHFGHTRAQMFSGFQIGRRWSHIRPLVGVGLRAGAEEETVAVQRVLGRVRAVMAGHQAEIDPVHAVLGREDGESDYWADPVEFLTHGGDCEDFAIAKYASLRMLGVPEDHLRIAIVRDLQKQVMHAILIVYTDNGDALILDNQNRRVLSSAS